MSSPEYCREYHKKNRERLNLARKRRYYENHKATLERVRKYHAEHKEEAREYYRLHHDEALMTQKKYAKNNPHKIKAHNDAQKIKLSDKCEMCGGKATDRHHPDYSKPLEVVHLCETCHYKLHRKVV